MTDKKEYNNVLKAIARRGEVKTAYNTLVSVAIDTEDEQLGKILTAVLGMLKFEVSRKGCVLEMFAPGQLHSNIVTLARYCRTMASRAEPQWTILARRANWTPPAAR